MWSEPRAICVMLVIGTAAAARVVVLHTSNFLRKRCQCEAPFSVTSGRDAVQRCVFAHAVGRWLARRWMMLTSHAPGCHADKANSTSGSMELIESDAWSSGALARCSRPNIESAASQPANVRVNTSRTISASRMQSRLFLVPSTLTVLRPFTLTLNLARPPWLILTAHPLFYKQQSHQQPPNISDQ